MRMQSHPSVVCTVLEDGGVLLNLETKFYYSLNRTGLLLWTLIEDGHADPLSAMGGRFPEAAGDPATATFLEALRKEELVTDAGPDGNAAPATVPDDVRWAPPLLTRHDVPLNRIMSNPFDPAVPLAE